MKTCKENNCNRHVFSHGFCLYHQYKRTDDKWDKTRKRRFSRHKTTSEQRSPSRSSKIPPRSKSRSNQEEIYKKVCAEIDREAKENGEYKCFFCGEPIDGQADHHHLNKKTNTRLYAKKFIVLAHRACHSEYHSLAVEKLIEKHWYRGFLKRLLSKSEILYRKETRKQEKAGLI